MFLKIFFPLIFFSLFNYTESRFLFKKIMNEKRLKKFYNCIMQKQNIGNITIDLVSSLMNNKTKHTNFTKYQQLFTDNFNIIKDCVSKSMIPHFPDGTKIINLNVVFKEKYDWTKFASCLLDKVKGLNESPFHQLIEYIKEGKYYLALREEFKLRSNGNMIVKQCMPTKNKVLLNKI